MRIWTNLLCQNDEEWLNYQNSKWLGRLLFILQGQCVVGCLIWCSDVPPALIRHLDTSND